MIKRGRPEGHRLSTASKMRIALSRTGKKQSTETKEKIAESLREYYGADKRQCDLINKARFLTPEGKHAKRRMSVVMKGLWASEAGLRARRSMSRILIQLHAETKRLEIIHGVIAGVRINFVKSKKSSQARKVGA